MIYCSAGVEAKVNYYFKDTKKVFQTKNTPINIETSQNNETGNLIGYGNSATVPSDWDGAEVWLFGTG